MLKRSKFRRHQGAATLKVVDKRHRFRICMVLLVLTAAYGIIAVRLVQLQVDPDARFSKEDLVHIGYDDIHRPRGDIFDRRGTILATDRFIQSLSADPSRVADPEALVQFLGTRLEVDADLLRRRFAQRTADGRPMKFIWIKQDLSEADRARLGDLANAPSGHALMMRQEMRRFYPNGDVAAHVLGFANREGKGAEGVEFAYDQYLRSIPGRKVSRVDRHRRFLDYMTLEFEPPSGGDDVVLTIDAELQYRLERALDAQMEDKGAPRGMGILMDPHTGAILAMASRPAFDPNRYNEYTDEERKNRAIVDVFEPGSAFKIVTASAALELGFITPNDRIDCEGGSFNPYGRTISDTHPRGVISFTQSFAESSNIAIIKVAAVLGPDRLDSWVHRYGFGTRTGIDLPKESPGIVNPRSRWSRLTMGSLPMGHEIAVTMIQLARAFSVIANGGYLVEPHVVDRAISQEGAVTYEFEQPYPVRILSEETADVMKSLCHAVVSGKESTGRYAVIPEYRAGGKTGTAQIPRTDGRGYQPRKYTAVFAGFAPIRDPRLTCVIVLQEPKYGMHWGGFASGPVFKDVVRDTLIRLNVPKDPMPGAAGYVDVLALPTTDADTLMARVELDLLEPGDLGLDDFELLELRPFERDEAEGGVVLPNLMGMTRREAKAALAPLGVQWDPRGAGRVVQQHPPAGTPVTSVTVCQLVFSNGPPELRDEA